MLNVEGHDRLRLQQTRQLKRERFSMWMLTKLSVGVKYSIDLLTSLDATPPDISRRCFKTDLDILSPACFVSLLSFQDNRF